MTEKQYLRLKSKAQRARAAYNQAIEKAEALRLKCIALETTYMLARQKTKG